MKIMTNCHAAECDHEIKQKTNVAILSPLQYINEINHYWKEAKYGKYNNISMIVKGRDVM